MADKSTIVKIMSHQPNLLRPFIYIKITLYAFLENVQPRTSSALRLGCIIVPLTLVLKSQIINLQRSLTQLTGQNITSGLSTLSIYHPSILSFPLIIHE